MFLYVSVTSDPGHITMNPRTPVQTSIDLSTHRLSVHEWGHAEDGQPSVVLIHATGFHGRTWDKVVNHLPHHHIVALDLRGHGASDAPNFNSWYDLGEDVAGTLRKLQLRHVILVGHSLGGVASVVAAHLEPNIVEKVMLIDPVILPPPVYMGMDLPMEHAEKTTKARQAEFPSIDAMINRYQNRQPFAVFDADVFRDYVQHGLKWDDNKQAFTLKCQPDFEAKIYTSMSSFKNIYQTLESLEQTVHVLRAMAPPSFDKFYGFSYSPTYPGLIQHIKNGKDIHLDNLTHFIPQQDPVLTAEHIKRLIEET